MINSTSEKTQRNSLQKQIFWRLERFNSTFQSEVIESQSRLHVIVIWATIKRKIKIPAYSFIKLLLIYCWRKPITWTIYVQLILTARKTRAGMAKIGVEGMSQHGAKTWFGAFKIVVRSSLPLISASSRPNLIFIFLNRYSKSRGIYTEEKDLNESKKIIFLNDFLWFIEIICLNQRKYLWTK